MDLKDMMVETDTHPYLMRMMRAYQDAGDIPARQDLLESQYPDSYVLPQTTGWLTFKSLVKQAGIDYEVALADAEEKMARAMEDDND